jgi:hypothetical protein
MTILIPMTVKEAREAAEHAIRLFSADGKSRDTLRFQNYLLRTLSEDTVVFFSPPDPIFRGWPAPSAPSKPSEAPSEKEPENG